MPFFTLKSKKVNSETSPQKSYSQQQEQVRLGSLTATAAGNNVSSAFLRDPMRNSKKPDVLGGFVDPMGGRAVYYHQGIDPTNTGA
ncbi:hypothetical protein BDB00DRAFT_812679 [Zychaea mexicana]|uniref:uncharacterized protein n=1 Tax=Zychaea mexicana TaxID=64656 RepID=UPI0022FDE907|nr:uncharacterized protein BDB00DRAFT_812679 [Zychaea mexicana]KAI9495622.1 hypothetical protein BDB00DRAFT_812679 [Zychaea mexicana]